MEERRKSIKKTTTNSHSQHVGYDGVKHEDVCAIDDTVRGCKGTRERKKWKELNEFNNSLSVPCFTKNEKKRNVGINIESLTNLCNMTQFMKMVRAHQHLFPEYIHWKMVFKFYRFVNTGPDSDGMYTCTVSAKEKGDPHITEVLEVCDLDGADALTKEKEIKEDLEYDMKESLRKASSIPLHVTTDDEIDNDPFGDTGDDDLLREVFDTTLSNPLVDNYVTEAGIVTEAGVQCLKTFVVNHQVEDKPLFMKKGLDHLKTISKGRIRDYSKLDFENYDIVYVKDKKYVVKFDKGLLDGNPCQSALIGCAMTALATYVANHTNSNVFDVLHCLKED